MAKKFLNAEGLATLWAAIIAKLDGKASASHTHSNYVNQNAFGKVTVGSTTVEADATTDTLTLASGTGVSLTGDATNDKVTIGLATSGVTAGTYRSVTVDKYGRITAGTTPTTLSGYGITDAKIASGVITLGGNTITPVTSSQMDTAISNAVSSAIVSVYKFCGVVEDVDDLPDPSTGRVGDVYSIKSSFSLTSNFLEYVSGKTITVGAGTDVVIVENSGKQLYNIMYKEECEVLTTAEVSAICV